MLKKRGVISEGLPRNKDIKKIERKLKSTEQKLAKE